MSFDDGLGAGARRRVGDVWRKRAQSELVVGARFSAIRAGFEREPASEAVARALEDAASDETRHSEICRRVAEHYTTGSLEPEPAPNEPLARFGEADEATSLLLHLVLMSCINEVTSTFYLREAMRCCRAKVARSALRELLADDVDHARIGWTHLASRHVGATSRRHVALALPTLLRLSHETWTSVRENGEIWFADHGCPGLAVARSAFERAVASVILPGFSAVGVDPTPGARWFAEAVRA